MAAIAAAGLSGCASGSRIIGKGVARAAGENSAGYLDRMSRQPSVAENDALGGILMLLDGKDDTRTFGQRVDVLEQRGIVGPSWSHKASRALTRGRLAYMICQACDIKGGIILRLLGPSRRYCLRELQYMEVMGMGSQWGQPTGMEFVAVLTRADVYIRTGKVPDVVGEIED